MGLSEKDCCIKCDKASELLTCSAESCPISVHQKCLGVKANLDEVGNFYCPFCLYRRATEELERAREKVVSGKKALSSFIGVQCDDNNKGKEKTVPECTTSACPVKGIHMPSDIAGVGDGDGDNLLMLACANDDTSSEENGTAQGFEMVRIGMSKLQRHNRDQLAEKIVGSVEDHSEENHSRESRETEEKELENEFSSSMEEEMEEHAKEINSSFDSDANLSVKRKRIREPNSSGKHVEVTSRKDPIDGMRRSLRNRSLALSPAVKKTMKNSPSNKLKKCNQSSTVSPRNIIHGSRRKNLPWSEDEVEMLQEGMKKFAETTNKNIPWRKILAFGEHVFHETRNPHDLKDKWRNILRKEK